LCEYSLNEYPKEIPGTVRAHIRSQFPWYAQFPNHRVGQSGPTFDERELHFFLAHQTREIRAAKEATQRITTSKRRVD
jgi:hypothetical protein